MAQWNLPAHHDRGHAQGGLGVGNRGALSILAAGAIGPAEVSSDPVDLFEDLGAIAAKGRAPDGLGLFAVPNEVGLRRAKYKIS